MNGFHKKIRDYYQVDGQPLNERNPKGLQDDYVKFIRFAQWRIEQTGYGVLAFVTNHGYLDNPTFRGMRRSLMQTFDEIYILDLHGNSKKKEKCPDGSKDENVFDIQQGVAIGIFVKRQSAEKDMAVVRHAHLWGLREVFVNDAQEEKIPISGKYVWLRENAIETTGWTSLQPQPPFYLFVQQDTKVLAEYDNCRELSKIFVMNGVGIATSRDDLTIQDSPAASLNIVKRFALLPPEEARQTFALGNDSRDWMVVLAQRDVNEKPISADFIKKILYRPFDFRFIYYTGKTRGFVSMPRYEIMRHMLQPNVALYVGRQGQAVGVDQWDLLFCGNSIEDYNLYRRGNNACFPLYIYSDQSITNLQFDAEKGLPTHPPLKNHEGHKGDSKRQANLTVAFINDFSTCLRMTFIPDGRGDGLATFGPEDVFHYMYAVFHSPAYRSRYAEFLKIDFPRLPLTSDAGLFRGLCDLGRELVALHLMEKHPAPATGFPIVGDAMVEAVRFTEPGQGSAAGRVWINNTQYFEGVLPEVWAFHVGGYQVCQKWLKDRKGRQLTYDDITHYQCICAALGETIRLMAEIDGAIDAHGGWPLK